MLRFVLALPVAAAVSGSLIPALQVSDNLLARADAHRPPTDACTVADGILAYCDDYLDEDAPLDEKANCYCCADTSELEPAFKTCEEYISTEYRSAYSVVATLQLFCDSVSSNGFSCATSTASSGEASSTDAQVTPSPTDAVPLSLPILGPPACTSLVSMIDKCRHKNVDDQANCVCYTNGGYNPRFDAYAAECDNWYASVDPVDVDYYQASTFCEAWVSSAGSYGPATGSATTDALSTDASLTVPTTTVSSTLSSALSLTPATTPKTTAGPSTATVTQTPSQTASKAGAAPNRAAGSGFVAWLAVVLPMAML